MTNVATPVNDESFLRDYRAGMAWEKLVAKYHARRSNLNAILTEWQEPERQALNVGGQAQQRYTLELSDGRYIRIKM